MAHDARTAGASLRLRRPRPAEDDAGTVAPADGADAQAVGPAAPDQIVETPGSIRDVDLAPGRQRRRGHLGAEGEGTPGHPCDQCRRRQVPGSEHVEHGRARQRPVVGQDPPEDVTAAPRGRDAVGRGRQVRRRDPHAQSGPRDRAGRGADHDGRPAGVPSDFALQRGEHPGLVGLADDTPRPEHEADGRTLDHPLFLAASCLFHSSWSRLATGVTPPDHRSEYRGGSQMPPDHVRIWPTRGRPGRPGGRDGHGRPGGRGGSAVTIRPEMATTQGRGAGSSVTVPLPTPDTVNLVPPDTVETQVMADGVATAVAGAEGLLPVQERLIEALFPAMTGHDVHVGGRPPVTPDELAAALSRRDAPFRSRAVQVMLLCALVRNPLPQDVADSVAEFARALGVDEGMLDVARDFAAGSLGLAVVDFQRNGYTGTFDEHRAAAVHASRDLGAWEVSLDDAELAGRWAALEQLPPETIGRKVWEMYRARGFRFPGDAGFGPAVAGSARLGPRPGRLRHDRRVRGGGVRDHRPRQRRHARVLSPGHGHLVVRDGPAPARCRSLRRLARALLGVPRAWRSGCRTPCAAAPSAATRSCSRPASTSSPSTGSPSPARRARSFALASTYSQSEAAVAAGSVGPWEPGGISPFQLNAGRKMADALGVPYDAHGASV